MNCLNFSHRVKRNTIGDTCLKWKNIWLQKWIYDWSFKHYSEILHQESWGWPWVWMIRKIKFYLLCTEHLKKQDQVDKSINKLPQELIKNAYVWSVLVVNIAVLKNLDMQTLATLIQPISKYDSRIEAPITNHGRELDLHNILFLNRILNSIMIQMIWSLAIKTIILLKNYLFNNQGSKKNTLK